MPHTKGPWKKFGNGISNHIHAGKRDVAIVTHNSLHPATEAEDVANAALISAAPELLEALKELYAHCAMVHNKWGAGCNSKEADAAIKAGLAAIAKAEGRED